MSDTPNDRVIAQPPLAVYIAAAPWASSADAGTETWVLDPRCRVEEIKRGLAGEISSAVVRVFAGPIESPSAGLRAGIAGDWIEDALSPGQVMQAFEAGLGARTGTPLTKFIHPDQPIMIARDWPAGTLMESAFREVLFAGFCDKPRYDQDESGGAVRESYSLLVEDAWKRVQTGDVAQVYGRWMRHATAAAEFAAFAADPANANNLGEPFQSSGAASAIDDLQFVEALACVFNPSGRGNCSPAPLELMIDRGAGPEPIRLYVFTHERDPHAVPWTFARALRYLAVAHYLGFADVLADLPWITRDGVEPEDWPAPTGLIGSGQREINGSKVIEVNAGSIIRPGPPVMRTDALAYELLGKPVDLDCDKTLLAEALELLAEAAGLRFAWRAGSERDSEGAPTGRPEGRLYVWARGAGRLQSFSREGSAGATSVTDLLDANNVSAVSLENDFTDVYPDPDIYGDVERYEITCELVPGWEPDFNLDVDSSQIDVALDYAKEHEGLSVEDGLHEDPWYQRFHKNGSLFQAYKAVGRRCVLNEDGRYAAQKLDALGQPLSPAELVYARSSPPWEVDQYAPWTPKRCNIRRPVINADGEVVHVAVRDHGDAEPADPIEVEAGKPWVAAPRPLRECFSADEDRQSLGVVVEVAALMPPYDIEETEENEPALRIKQLAVRAGETVEDPQPPGLTWVRLRSIPILTLAQHASVYIDAEDLTQVTPWAEDDTLVDKQGDPLSLWAAMVEGRLLIRVTAVIEGDHFVRPRLSTATGGATKQFEVAKKFHQNRRDLANSVFAAYPEGELEFPAGNKPADNRPAPEQTRDTDDDADLLELQAASAALLATSRSRLQPGVIRVPWVTEQFGVGDTIEQIAGSGIVFTSPGDDGTARAPDIVAVETRPGRTEFYLEDTRLLEELQKNPAGPFAVAKVEREERRLFGEM